MNTWLGQLVVGLGLALPGVVAANTLTADLTALQAQVEAVEVRLADVQATLAQRRNQHAAADREMRRGVQAAVRLGQYPPGFWLARSMLTDAPVQVGLVQAMTRQQARRMQASQAEAEGLSRLYGQANAQLEALRQVQAAYADSRHALLQVERQVLRRAGVQAAALEQGLAEALVRVPTAAAPVQELITSTPEVAGGLPVAGRVLQGFGRSEGATRDGVVLAAPEGAPVVATRAAKVLFAGPFRHFGGLVIVKTVRGEDMLLGGMGTLNVNAGDDVVAGQQLGLVGEEGRIYWEVRRRGRVVNPL